MVFIGSGQPSLIARYRERTMGELREKGEAEYRLYCDPQQDVYQALGMVQSYLEPATTPGYIVTGYWSKVFSGTLSLIPLVLPFACFASSHSLLLSPLISHRHPHNTADARPGIYGMLTTLPRTGLTFGGPPTQNGGEFLFDGEGKLVWSHRMQNTADHVEVGELSEVLGVKA